MGGYAYVYKPEHPRATKRGYILEHWLVAEEILGRLLNPEEHVHHINHKRADNRKSNLVVMTKHEHLRLHGLAGNRKRWHGSKEDGNPGLAAADSEGD